MSHPTPRAIIFYSMYISFLNGFWDAYSMHFSDAWYGLVPTLTCNVEVPLKHPVPLRTSLNSSRTALWYQHLLSCQHSFQSCYEEFIIYLSFLFTIGLGFEFEFAKNFCSLFVNLSWMSSRFYCGALYT